MNAQRSLSAEQAIVNLPDPVDTQDGLTWAARLINRAGGLMILAVVLLVLGLAGRSIYFMITDSWIAPIHMSPSNDAVLQLQVRQNREQAEMARVEADLERIDGDLAAVAAAVQSLSKLREGASAPLTWQADSRAAEQAALRRVIDALRAELKVVARQHTRQAALTAAARKDLAAGLIDRREMQHYEQMSDSLEIALAEKRRLVEQARHEERVAASEGTAYRTELGLVAPGGAVAGMLPEVATRKEHAARVELELMRLEAEQRSLVALRRVAEQGLARQRELLIELESRPLYRAMHRSTDVGFVPYDQLEGVYPGAPVLACTWGLFWCEDVGRVGEILDGEVATQDPWGDLARGQYVILELTDPDAIREKLLRIRP